MFCNNTSFPAQAVPSLDAKARDVVIVVTKATFEVGKDGALAPAREPVAIRMNDVAYNPDSATTSLRYPTDLCVEKGGTDVVVVGEAFSPRPAASVDVAIQARDRTAVLRVHGRRFFLPSPMGLSISPATPFERMPVVFEKAYGGVTEDFTVIEPRNWAGVGVAKRAKDLEGKPAPQIEHPSKPHCTGLDRHPPVGCGAIMTHWSPRRELAGTFDDLWRMTRMPALPIDFDIRFNNVAHPSLIFHPFLQPGEVVSVLGMSEELVRFAIPNLGLVVRARTDHVGTQQVALQVDTILIEPGLRRVELTARAAFPTGRGHAVLRELTLDRETVS